MGKRVRVQLFGLQNRGVQIDADATEGARVGKNLLWPDGTVVTEEELRSAGTTTTTTSTTGTSTVATTLWSLILSIPAIIRSLAALTGKGWIRNDSNVISASQWAYNKLSVDTGEEMTIPAGHELIVFQNFTMDGGVTLDGDLVILE